MATGSFARASLKMTIIMHSRKQKAGAAQPPLLSLFTPAGLVILSAAKDLLAITLLTIPWKVGDIKETPGTNLKSYPEMTLRSQRLRGETNLSRTRRKSHRDF
jgi:hypothetical protein